MEKSKSIFYGYEGCIREQNLPEKLKKTDKKERGIGEI